MMMNFSKTLIAVGLSFGLTLAPMAAHADALNASPMLATGEAAVSNEGLTIVGLDGEQRSIVPDDLNTTSYQGLSATVNMAPTDQIVLLDDDRTFLLQDASGGVLLNSVNPTLGDSENPVDAKFVVEGDKLIVTPVNSTGGPRITKRSACASSFWGNLIFNVGMSGVCAMLGIGTGGVGGVACSMALIGANLGINWDKPCK
ncbi:hypothetical protein G7067_05790 [Leucobacter insecticola]|uniref:Uncharacterized protein n=1 Tax=Leucobacter insecticola TaxID=2714934 RepID=A0A6G8FI67_9MICO|nr:hypothetical protein [Leucobacter insecticola]QIM16041.1 hypothetical protein G7067_05790 [Leucobacter insecticola]